MRNNKTNRLINRSLDKKWKKGTPTRTYIGELMTIAHLDGQLEGMDNSLRNFPYMIIIFYALAMFIGFMYESIWTVVGNIAIFTAVYLGLGYLLRRKDY